jgi:hypothetical protein
MKSTLLSSLVTFLCGWLFSAAPAPRAAAAPSAREAVLAVARAEIGVHETGNANTGPRVKLYQRAAGISPGDPWCAAFVYWVGLTALPSPPYPRTGWSPDMLAGGHRDAARVQPADLIGIYFPSKGRVAHVAICEKSRLRSFVTLEGNTSPDAAPGSAADRNGGEVCRKIRPVSSNLRYKAWLP